MMARVQAAATTAAAAAVAEEVVKSCMPSDAARKALFGVAKEQVGASPAVSSRLTTHQTW